VRAVPKVGRVSIAIPEAGKVSIAAPERCTKVFALSAVRNVRFHSGQQETALSTVKSVGPREDHQEQRTAAKENIPSKTAREALHQLQRMLISKS
jgi:hypothetical protein